MIKNFHTMLGHGTSGKEKALIKKEFRRETTVAFEFDYSEEGEEVGALEKLEGMLLGQGTVEIIDAMERMDRLVDLFKDRLFEPAQRFSIIDILMV